MGAGISRKQYNSQGIQQPGMILPPTQPSKIYDLQFILDNPPPIILQPQQNTPINQAQNMQKLNAIKAKIIEYNKTWNFGNKSDGQPQSLLKKETYENFIAFVTDLIQERTTPNQMRATMNANAKSYQDKKNIVREIHNLVSAGGNKLVNEFFQVEMSEIFPNFPGVKLKDPMMVNLLGLASIFGAEHIVIYLLMIGADPSITKTDNRDSATLMLSFQIGIYKLLQSNPQQQQQPINLKYFIILPRILYILFLLGSIGEGVDLSAIFETNEKKINQNNSKKPTVPVKSSILNMLAQMPGNTSDETARQTLQNGGSIPLLLEILEKNNPNPLFKPKFFKVINSLETPYDINVLYSVLMNPNIDDKTKLKLTELLVIKYDTNITNVPTFIEKGTNIDIFDRIILAIDDIKFTNPQTKLSILEIFSFSNKEFKDRLERSGLLRKYSNSNTNKNAKIKRLETEVALLRQKSKLITNSLAGSIAALGAKSAFINAQMDSLTKNQRTVFGTNKGLYQLSSPQSTANKFATGQPQIPTNPFTTNQRFAKQDQPQIQPTGFGTNPAANLASVQPVLPLSSSQILPPGSALPQTSAPVSYQPNIKSKSLISSTKDFFFGKKNQTGPQNTTPLLSGQRGGKQIQMRTYHFLKNKKYSERAFIAERPIIAADNAYDFMKLHYDIGSKKITFTIHDRVNNKKYKYTAKTLKDGTNVIKSAK
jgi:hypothetical protein